MHFGAGMSHDVAQDLYDAEDKQGEAVHRHDEQEKRHEGAVHDGLGDGEGIGGPRSRRARQVVRAMEQREQAPVMHGAVGPVEIGVVGQQHHGERQDEVEWPRLAKTLVDRDPALVIADGDDRAQQREDEGRAQRRQEFAPPLAAGGVAGLQLAAGEACPPEQGEDRGHQRGGHEVAGGVHGPDRGPGRQVDVQQFVHRSPLHQACPMPRRRRRPDRAEGENRRLGAKKRLADSEIGGTSAADSALGGLSELRRGHAGVGLEGPIEGSERLEARI